MSSYKFFYIAVFLLTLCLFAALGFFGRRYIESDVILTIAESSNLSVSELYTKTVVKPYEKFIGFLPCDYIEGKGRQRCPKNINVAKERIAKKIEDTPISEIRMYTKDGVNMLDESKILSMEDMEDFKVALSGKVHSELQIGRDVGQGEAPNVVRSFIPIRVQEGGDIVTVLELYHNITPFWKKPLTIFVVFIAAAAVFFMVIFGYMYYLAVKYEQEFTRQYEANRDLESAKESAEKENRSKSQFLANISHELRTPLNAIIGFSEIVKDEVMGPLNNQQYKEYITDIHLSGVHLLSLINDILDYSKADAGKLTLEKEDVDVTKIMKNSLRLVSPRADEAGVVLVAEIPNEHVIINTDGKRLKQALLNLFSNAVKFTSEGGTVTLYAWKNVSENTFIMEVKDTGVGIAPKDISKVMATFGQVENKLSRRYEGTGLGLPLTKKLVELMGGKLEIQSEEGVGTVVSIIIPYTPPEGDYA